MNPYVVRWWGPAKGQYDALLGLARSAGKFAEFRYWFQEVGRQLADPGLALNVGSPLAPTALPGGFCRQLQCGCFYLRYVVFPDEDQVYIYLFASGSPSWP